MKTLCSQLRCFAPFCDCRLFGIVLHWMLDMIKWCYYYFIMCFPIPTFARRLLFSLAPLCGSGSLAERLCAKHVHSCAIARTYGTRPCCIAMVCPIVLRRWEKNHHVVVLRGWQMRGTRSPGYLEHAQVGAESADLRVRYPCFVRRQMCEHR